MKEPIKIGSSHNRAPMPFNKEIGSSITYQSAKAANWSPGDYTKFAKNLPETFLNLERVCLSS